MRKKIFAATAGLLLLGSIAAYAYVAVTATATVNVSEALYVDAVTIFIGQRGGTCTRSQDLSSASCSIEAFPGESGSLNIQIANRGSAPLNTTETASSSSNDVTLTVPQAQSVPGSGSAFFPTGFAVSPSATPGSITINVQFSR